MKIEYILVVLMMIFVLNAEASSPVTYSCCQTFETSNGTLIDSFDDHTLWTKNAGNITWETDTAHYKEGSGAIKISSNASTGSGAMTIRHNVGFEVNDVRNYGLWMYAENVTNISTVYIFFFNSTTNTSRSLTYVLNMAYELNSGWNYIIFSPNEMTQNGGQSLSERITAIQLRVNNNAGSNIANVTFDNFRYNITGRPKIILSFDDSYNTSYSLAYPLMSSYSQRGVLFPTLNTIDTTDKITTEIADAVSPSHPVKFAFPNANQNINDIRGMMGYV